MSGIEASVSRAKTEANAQVEGKMEREKEVDRGIFGAARERKWKQIRTHSPIYAHMATYRHMYTHTSLHTSKPTI